MLCVGVRAAGAGEARRVVRTSSSSSPTTSGGMRSAWCSARWARTRCSRGCRRPNLDRLAAEGARFGNAFVHDVALLAEPGVAAERPLRASPPGAEQLHGVSRRPAELSAPRCRRPGTRRPTSASGTWARTTTRQRPGFDSLDEPPAARATTSTTSSTSTARGGASTGYYTTVVTDARRASGSAAHATAVAAGRSARRRRMAGRSSRSRGSRRPSTTCRSRSRRTTTNYRAADGKPAWLEESLATWHGVDGPLYDLKQHDKFVRAYLGDAAVGGRQRRPDLRGAARVRTTRRHASSSSRATTASSSASTAAWTSGRCTRRASGCRCWSATRGWSKAGTVVSQMVLSLDLAPTLIDVCGAQPLDRHHTGGRACRCCGQARPTGGRRSSTSTTTRSSSPTRRMCAACGPIAGSSSATRTATAQPDRVHGGAVRPAAGPARDAQPVRRSGARRDRRELERLLADVSRRGRAGSHARLRRHRQRPAVH